jgi:hypothetical protein
MENQEIDIEALKTDKEFLANLEKLDNEMHSQNSIAKGYQLLDAKLVIESPEDDINDVFTFIVNTAFDKLADKLTEPSKFDMSDPEEWATARAIYEHGIQRYSDRDKKGAKEIFLVLYHMITIDEVKDAMMIHACAVMAGHSFEDFMENLVDLEGIDIENPMAFFITTFTQPNDILLSMFSKYVKEGKDELKALEANS